MNCLCSFNEEILRDIHLNICVFKKEAASTYNPRFLISEHEYWRHYFFKACRGAGFTGFCCKGSGAGGGGGWIRTSVRRYAYRVYSPAPLTTRPPLRHFLD